MSRHLLQLLTGLTPVLLVLVSAPGCVDDRASTARRGQVVLPDLSTPAVPPTRRRASPRHAPAKPPAPPDPAYADAPAVARRLGDPRTLILDLRSARAFAMGHLPGAVSDPGGRALLAAARARPGRPPVTAPPGAAAPGHRRVVFVHGGHTLRDRAVAARAYLLLYAAGAPTSQLAILRGGYAAWRRARRPLVTATAPNPRGPRAHPRPTPPTRSAAPRATPPPAAPHRPSPAVLLTNPAALAAARRHPRTVLVQVGRLRPRLRPGRPAPPWLRLGISFLQPAPGAQPHALAELHQRLAALLAGRSDARLIAFGDQGLWASLLWLTLKTRLQRPDALNTVYLGPAPAR